MKPASFNSICTWKKDTVKHVLITKSSVSAQMDIVKICSQQQAKVISGAIITNMSQIFVLPTGPLARNIIIIYQFFLHILHVPSHKPAGGNWRVHNMWKTGLPIGLEILQLGAAAALIATTLEVPQLYGPACHIVLHGAGTWPQTQTWHVASDLALGVRPIVWSETWHAGLGQCMRLVSMSSIWCTGWHQVQLPCCYYLDTYPK